MSHRLIYMSLLSSRVVWPSIISLTAIGVVVICSLAMIEAGQQSGNGIAVVVALRKYAELHNGSYPAELRDDAFLRFLSDRPRHYVKTSRILYISPGPAASKNSPVLILSGNFVVTVISLDAKCGSLSDSITLQQSERKETEETEKDRHNP